MKFLIASFVALVYLASRGNATPTANNSLVETKSHERVNEDPIITTEFPDLCNHDCEYRAIDCHTYYTCVNYHHREYHECRWDEGLAFNPRLKVCDWIENVPECGRATTPQPACNCTYKPFHGDCSKYYYCPDSCRPELCEERDCPEGMAWTIDFYLDGSGHQQCTRPIMAICPDKVKVKVKKSSKI